MANAGQVRKQMRIALVGIRPADQITLKGYLRVLLRLDVELAWVSATDSPIDLFMINEDFRGATSVTRVLQSHPNIPALYIDRVEAGDGGIHQNVLTLPLKQINLLNDWLIRHVSVLSGLARSMTPTSPNGTADLNGSEAVPVQSVTQPKGSTNLSALADIMQTLYARPKASYELVDGGQVIAIIEASRQRAWLKPVSAKLSSNWQLRPYQGHALDAIGSVDLVAWLWQMAWQNHEELLPFVDNAARYQVRYWVKPSNDGSRRDLLQVMTAIEGTPRSITEMASRAGVSPAIAKKVIASLLFSGSLTAPSYQHLREQATSSNQTVTLATTAQPIKEMDVEPAPSKAPEPSPQQEEKLGFLARLRKKLGL